MMLKPIKNGGELIASWSLSAAATLGSSVRAKGILLEIRARLPTAVRKSLDINSGELTLKMPEMAKHDFRTSCLVIASALKAIENLPVIPREIQDILTISATERHRWLADGRLPSVGTRTVRLAGRAKKITFHVFDPRLVEELLNTGVVEDWREQDAVTAAENRRRAAWKAQMTRALKKSGGQVVLSPKLGNNEPRPDMTGWHEFDRDGLLR